MLAALTVAATPLRVSGQVESRDVVYAELLGNGGLFSINYERRVSAVHMRVGFASWTIDDLFGIGQDRFTVVPVTVSHLVGSGSHHLESGGGVTLGVSEVTSGFGGSSTSAGFVSLTGIVGYRYQKPTGGFIFRAALTPFYGFGREGVAYPDRGFFPSLGISFGAAF